MTMLFFDKIVVIFVLNKGYYATPIFHITKLAIKYVFSRIKSLDIVMQLD